MMEGILKVTPERLLQTSGEFASLGTQMKNLTGEMMTLVKSLNSIWQGEAASAYGSRFFFPCAGYGEAVPHGTGACAGSAGNGKALSDCRNRKYGTG